MFFSFVGSRMVKIKVYEPHKMSLNFTQIHLQDLKNHKSSSRNIYVDQQLFPNQTIGHFIHEIACKYFSLSTY